MLIAPRIGDIDDETNILATKVKLTRNEYTATVRNKLEYNRLKTFNRHMNDQNDLDACKLRTKIHDLKKYLNINRKVVFNIDEFFIKRKVKFTVTFFL